MSEFGPIARAFARHRARRSTREFDAGFTLVELVIVITIMPLIVGAIGIALVSMFNLQSSVSSRVTNSADAQVVSANFNQDVKSALQITTVSTAACGTGTQVLGLEWDFSANTNGYLSVVSYVAVPMGTKYALVRNFCSKGASSTPDSTFTVSYDVPASQTVPTIQPTSLDAGAAAGWIPTTSVTAVVFSITEPSSNYNYTLNAVPANNSTQNTGGQPTFVNTNSTCSKANPGTGYYANSLCFVDFGFLNVSGTPPPVGSLKWDAENGGVSVSVKVPGGYIMTMTVTVVPNNTGGQYWAAAAFPTWTNAFLGNCTYNGVEATCQPAGPGVPFYTGVKNFPAIYQVNPASNGTDTVTFSDIKVFNPQGLPATGWQAVMTDAETTDPYEYLTFSSDQNLTVIPNDPTNPNLGPYGNDCNYGAPLTWSGPKTVTCSGGTSGGSYPKTGTLMVEALAPSMMSAIMHGAGLEGVSFALMLS
jgi:prepilin-type N-terminal cleavage/methylation domain-containing protein